MLLESIAESAVTAETALLCQLLESKRLLRLNSLTIEVDEMVDTQTIDIGIISIALPCKIFTKIKTVRTNRLGKLVNGQVALQVEFHINAALL